MSHPVVAAQKRDLGARPDAALSTLKPYRPVLEGIYNWLWIIATIFMGQKYGWNIFTVPMAMIVIGIHLHRNAILGHDGAHFLITRNRFLNDLFVNLLFFWPVFATVSGYRHWHLQHHRWLGTDRDPEREIKSGPRYALPMKTGHLLGQCILDLVGYGANEVLRLLLVMRPQKKIDMLGPVLWWTIFGGTLLIMGYWPIVLIFIASILTAFWSVFRMRAWFEHQGIEGTHRFSANPILRYIYFPHNTWCHYEHHKWPYLPYYALPEARKLDGEHKVVNFSDVLSRFESFEE